MWTPNHSHKGTHQLVISLGTSRTLQVGNKDYLMENGDVILFGSSMHGIKPDQSVNGRISIATFMVPVDSLPKQLYYVIDESNIDNEQFLLKQLITFKI